MSGQRVERRLAAILAADVAGYSRLMGEDEAGTLARLRTHRRELIDPKVSEHKGRVVKTTGDGILIEFPSVVEAVACALAVQQGMAERNAATPEAQRIVFRVGINLGDVIVEEGDIHGDGVNVAARLEGIAEPGGICVSAVVSDQVQGRVDCAFDDLGDQALKNINRAVRVYRLRHNADQSVPHAASAGEPPGLALPDKPSIAVLPFQNMSGDPEQEYFADGMVEDIITALSRYPFLFVIARTSCFVYKRRALDTKQIGRELGVRYILEGSVRKSANRIRVTAQLIEAETGNHVWAERYDRDLADIFLVQDEITEAVTSAIAPAVAHVEQRRALRKPSENLDAWGAYQRGLWHVSRYKLEDNSLAQKFFQQAIDSDPLFAGGYIGLALAINIAAVHLKIRDLTEALIAEEALATRAVELDPSNAEAHAKLSITLGTRGDNQAALAEAKRALALCPNLAYAHGALGVALTFSGEPKQGVEALETCIRLDPVAPMLSGRLNQLSIAYYFCREYEACIEAAKRAVRALDSEAPFRWLAAAFGQLGRGFEAKEALDRAIEIAPALFDVRARSRPPWMRPEDHAHMLDGLRKAGWND